MTPQLEICAADIDSVIAAAAGGAQRVELCSGLSEGGMTPSAGLVAEALKQPGIKVHVLVRPRPGDFLYTDTEVKIMQHDIELMRSLGVHGVVIGALTPEGDIDTETCRRLTECAEGINITFHRAFDLTRNPLTALDQIIELGCNRVLTSGCAPTALEGIETLRRLNDYAAGRITILAGAGISPQNAASIMQRTGIHELHASARSLLTSRMLYHNENVSMGNLGTDEYARMSTSASIVRDLVSVMNNKTTIL